MLKVARKAFNSGEVLKLVNFHGNKNVELLLSGFVQSLEFLKRYGNLRTTFPDLEKVWKLKAKS